ncbi:hypothetical protein GUITHDRAFT_153588 [Guillardia theta CCMP2712]|uniref:Uncharacterized protein n=1 Tax=Guillardia theta (strain CCMP2712) TaxID=905079 RepID=L1J2I5_GUITC|nr:hypothetical protein GUITHDRAFT_153588 [Guillardia theta CCMP2712]EKX42334.1 hypothetical protein GUITHDRAFT_153588 [Guillardia theta CCMP2712]|eukprot:XP_005829314.1 hypothetical protein GUITHDRAFT_153588 [Guillardia theta CCMP2712]
MYEAEGACSVFRMNYGEWLLDFRSPCGLFLEQGRELCTISASTGTTAPDKPTHHGKDLPALRSSHVCLISTIFAVPSDRALRSFFIVTCPSPPSPRSAISVPSITDPICRWDMALGAAVLPEYSP